MKKFIFISLLAICSVARSADPEWEWVRAFKIMVDAYALSPNATWKEMVFHFSRNGLREALENDRQYETLVELYRLEKGDIEKLHKGTIPERFKDLCVEFGRGDSDDTCEVLISKSPEGN